MLGCSHLASPTNLPRNIDAPGPNTNHHTYFYLRSKFNYSLSFFLNFHKKTVLFSNKKLRYFRVEFKKENSPI